ncbi:MAG: O-antigen ligase family protein [Pseudomonadota bacterium]
MASLGFREQVFAAATAPAAAVSAAVFVLGVLAFSKTIAFVMVGAILFAYALWASGNPRLLSLWGLILTAPLTIGKDFMTIPHMGGAGAYSIEAADVFLLILLVFLLRDAVAWRRPVRLPPIILWWGIAIFIGILHMALGDLRNLAGQEVFQMSKGALLFIVLINEVVRVRQFEHIFWALTGSVFLQSLIAIAQYIKKGDLGLQILGEAEGKYLELTNIATFEGAAETFRIGGLLGHPNLFAGFVAIFAPVLLASLSVRMGQLRKAAVVIVLGTAGLALLLTLSRSGWISAAFGLTVTLALGMLSKHHARRFAPITIIGMVGASTAGLLASPLIIKRIFQSDSGALDFRWEWMAVAWQMVKENPITGVGLNSFVFRLPGNNPYGGVVELNQRFGENWPVVHNIYLIFWSELGTFGLVALVGTFLGLILMGMMAIRRVKQPMVHAMIVGGIGGTSAIALDGMASFFIRNPACGRIFWIVAALIVAGVYWERANRHRTGHSA